MNGNFLPPIMGSHHVMVLGKIVKQIVTRASLQRPISNQILTADKLFGFCVGEIKGILVFILKKSRNW